MFFSLVHSLKQLLCFWRGYYVVWRSLTVTDAQTDFTVREGPHASNLMSNSSQLIFSSGSVLGKSAIT